ncbi:hypothetical protein [Stenotrophomonas tumulicola]|uniref:Uncharacterized protein n=1 Tax=Stenotrophomonas tumulicola TaxID=1685415 RepID=A0A7W3IIF0_9GAMM|nr:hypothetical protein [Stenotrophomonas tumulicola]MBA8683048.1 hypothetical protein [Stenotrophomonas tumulicola]
MRQWIRFLLLSGLLLVSAASLAGDISRKQRKQLEDIQTAYASTIRWGSMEDALAYLDPEQRKADPLSEFELRRYSQLRVSSYRERSTAALPNGIVERRVEVGVININTQAERTVGVIERWRWDPDTKRWWQTNGLPDLWQGQ